MKNVPSAAAVTHAFADRRELIGRGAHERTTTLPAEHRAGRAAARKKWGSGPDLAWRPVRLETGGCYLVAGAATFAGAMAMTFSCSPFALSQQVTVTLSPAFTVLAAPAALASTGAVWFSFSPLRVIVFL